MGNGLEKLTETTLKQLKGLIDANTVVGSPIPVREGSVVVPVSQIKVGYTTGGGEYGNGHFAGGSGAGVTVTPIAMMLITERGVKLLPIDTVNATINNVTEAVPETIDRIGEIIATLKGNQSHS